MLKRRFLILLLFGAVSANGQKRMRVSYDTTRQDIFVDTSRIAIFEEDNSGWLFGKVKGSKLNFSELKTIEILYTRCLDLYNSRREKEYEQYQKEHSSDNDLPRENWIINYPTYYRQYIPVINENGQKEVWISGFCEVGEGWRHLLRVVHDGGNCYFQLKVNLTKMLYYDFFVNGIN